MWLLGSTENLCRTLKVCYPNVVSLGNVTKLSHTVATVKVFNLPSLGAAVFLVEDAGRC